MLLILIEHKLNLVISPFLALNIYRSSHDVGLEEVIRTVPFGWNDSLDHLVIIPLTDSGKDGPLRASRYDFDQFIQLRIALGRSQASPLLAKTFRFSCLEIFY